MLVRIARRKTSPEAGLLQFVQVEFLRDDQPDLNLSVYEVGPHEVIRIRTEHYAGADLEPRRGAVFNVTGLHVSEPIPILGDNRYFSFARERHRELPFANEAELEYFAHVLLISLEERTHEVKKQEMKDYVIGRLREADKEWLRFCIETSNFIWKKWASEVLLKSTPIAAGSGMDAPTDSTQPASQKHSTKWPRPLMSAWKWLVSIFRLRS